MYFISYATRTYRERSWEFRHKCVDEHPLVWLKRQEDYEAELKEEGLKLLFIRIYTLINWKVISPHEAELYEK